MALTDPDPYVEVIIEDDLVVLGYTGPRLVDVIVDVGAPGPRGLGVPPGGLHGEVLTKLSDFDNDADWEPSQGGTGGTGAIEVYASTNLPPATGTAIVWQDLRTLKE